MFRDGRVHFVSVNHGAELLSGGESMPRSLVFASSRIAEARQTRPENFDSVYAISSREGKALFTQAGCNSLT